MAQANAEREELRKKCEELQKLLEERDERLYRARVRSAQGVNGLSAARRTLAKVVTELAAARGESEGQVMKRINRNMSYDYLWTTRSGLRKNELPLDCIHGPVAIDYVNGPHPTHDWLDPSVLEVVLAHEELAAEAAVKKD